MHLKNMVFYDAEDDAKKYYYIKIKQLTYVMGI